MNQILQKFKSSIRRGTGEAYLLMKANPTIDFSDEIIKACIKNYAYDGQMENSRGDYFFELISLSKKQDKIKDTILNALTTEERDAWTLTQLFDLAKIYAQKGDKLARQTIYDRFMEMIIYGTDWAGFYEIIELDNLKGLLFIAEKKGKYLENNPESWEDDHIIKYFQDEYPDFDAMLELEKAGRDNSYIRLYVERVKETLNRRSKNYEKKTKYKNVIDKVLSSPSSVFYRIGDFSKRELKLIADRLLVEQVPENIEKLLHIFWNFKYPYDPEFILSLAKCYSPDEYGVSYYALLALKNLSSENIRDYALDKLKKTSEPGFFVEILISNYRVGDNILLTELLKKYRSPHTIHDLALSYISIFEKNKTPECKEPLEKIYDKVACCHCRRDAVEILNENGVLSDRIKQEMRYDCSFEIRKLIS